MLILECSGITRSIPWLLMPWLHASPGHQQPWHWLCGINGFSLSSTRKDFSYQNHLIQCRWMIKMLRSLCGSKNEAVHIGLIFAKGNVGIVCFDDYSSGSFILQCSITMTSWWLKITGNSAVHSTACSCQQQNNNKISKFHLTGLLWRESNSNLRC